RDLHSFPTRRSSDLQFRIDKRSQIQFPIHPVKKLEHFDLKKEYAVFCPVRQASFAEASELMSRAVLHCRQENIAKPLIDSTGLLGFQPPGITEQFNVVECISSNAKSSA